MEALRNHINSVIGQVQALIDQGKIPNPQQLESYTKQVVQQLKDLTARAPAHIRNAIETPWTGYYDFENNCADPNAAEFKVDDLLEVLRDIVMLTERGPPSTDAPSNGVGAAPPAPPAPAAPPKPNVPAPSVTASTGLVTGTNPFKQPAQGHQMQFVTDRGGKKLWVQDLSNAKPFQPGGVEAVKTRRDEAPPISAASMRMPTYEKKDLILAAIRRNRVTVISGDTGCGKSTLIPQLVCDAVNLVDDDKVVICTQPRRVAAITLPEYVAKDRNQTMGDEVGYQIRFVNEFCDHTRLIYATTAIILRRLHAEPELESIGCLIVDEVHERDVYTDFLLLLIRNAMMSGRMQHLKIVGRRGLMLCRCPP